MKLFAEISKTEELDDGTIKVWGYASSDVVDSDGETITADAMKAALPDYMKFGAVREMHQAKAAGTAIEAEVQEDGRTFFGAHVVDSEAVKKVKAGVYKGFSIGGKATERDELNKSIIKSLKLVEVSLVDRPANPEAVFTMYKAEGLGDGDGGGGAPAAEAPAIDQLADLLNKRQITPEQLLGLAKTAAAPAPDTLEKGMWSVQDFASVIATLGWICQDAQSETDWEGDSSPVPAQLRTWFAQGIEIFKAMAAEETAELLASLKTSAGEIDVIEMAARGSDIAKAGAKFSKDAKDKLAKAHQAIKAASYHLASTGYDQDGADSDTGKAAGADDLAKVAGELDLAKSDLVKVAGERDALQKRVKELEAMPAPGKALLKAVGKAADVGDTLSGDSAVVNKVAPVVDARGEENEVASLIKMVHSSGGVRASV